MTIKGRYGRAWEEYRTNATPEARAALRERGWLPAEDKPEWVRLQRAPETRDEVLAIEYAEWTEPVDGERQHAARGVFEVAEALAGVTPVVIKEGKLEKRVERVAKAMAEDTQDEDEVGRTTVTIRLDNRVIAAFKALGPGYQLKINDALLEMVRRGLVGDEGYMSDEWLRRGK